MTANTTSRTESTATAIPWRKEDHFIPKKESGSATERPTPGQPATPNTPVSRTTTPAELEALGWQVNFQVNPDTQSETVAGIQTRIPHWQELNQAERLYHQAAYGFDHEGRLQLPADQLTSRASKSSHHQASPALEAVLDGRLQHSTEYPYTYGLPNRPLPSWATRLHQLLPTAAEYWVGFSYDDSALAWFLPDQSLIYTNEIGWGIPGHQEGTSYFEFGTTLPELFTAWPIENYEARQPEWTRPPKD